jgi:cytochrome c oxidase cbb3-type subunit III
MKRVFLIGALSLCLTGCKREQRIFRPEASASDVLNAVQVSGLHPGPGQEKAVVIPQMYQESAYAVSEGQRLYEQYNCVGCHAHGGGGMGPALMDNVWIYGSEPANIFATVMQGRPNGMPSFRNRIPEYQAWEIAAYVRSLSGLLPKDVAPNRTDEMDVKPAESSMPRQTPTGITGAPSRKQ